MSFHLEVCVDNIESIPIAIDAGATRIELCSALALGGLTPSAGMMKIAKQVASVPVYAMIRPRQGDFFFNEQELDIMFADIEAAKLAKLDGIVIGVLTANGQIDLDICRQLIERADGMGITFHRAIDQCQDAFKALEDIISLGCERILTSGLCNTAEAGIGTIAKLHQQANGRIQIMPGTGVNANNAGSIIEQTQVREIHMSGKTLRSSKMSFIAAGDAQMGVSDISDDQIPVTSFEAVNAVNKVLNQFK
jgi:copper homeostasis protein